MPRPPRTGQAPTLAELRAAYANAAAERAPLAIRFMILMMLAERRAERS